MDMTRHLRRWLNDAELQRRGGRYEGIIADVLEEPVNNRFKGVRQVEPVIQFDDGWRLVPNMTMRRQLITMFGPETDDWRGRRLVVFRRCMERLDRGTGQVRERFEKAVMCADPHFRQAPSRAASATNGRGPANVEAPDELSAAEVGWDAG